MNRTYIPFYLNKESDITLYYDYVEQVFFTSPNGRQGGFFSILSGMTGVMLYLFLKDIVFRISGDNGLFVILFSLLLSVIVAFGMVWGTVYLIKRIGTKSKKSPHLLMKKSWSMFAKGKSG